MILGTGNWQRIYRIVAIVILIVVVMEIVAYEAGRQEIDLCSAGVKDKSGKKNIGAEISESRIADFSGFFSDKKVWIAAASMLVFGAAQGGVVAWSVKYSRDVFADAGPLQWALALSFYWLGTTICRLLMGIVTALQKWDSRKAIIWGGILAGGALLAGVLSGGMPGFLAGILTFGFLNGETLPKLVGFMNGWYPAQTGLASGVTFVALYLGLGLFPLLMGVVASAADMKSMMLVPVTATVLSGIVGAALPKQKTTSMP